MLWPDPQRRGEIAFLFAKALPYHTRVGVIVGLLVVGFGLQLLSVWIGAPLLLAATLLSLVSGYSNIPKRLPGKREWRGAARENLENVVKLNKRIKHWDQSYMDITCGRGVLALIALGTVVAAIAYVFWVREQDWLMTVWIVDAVVLVVPHWFSGIRRILTNDPLAVKIDNLLAVMNVWEGLRKDGEAMVPQMQIRTGKTGELPHDAKVILRFADADDSFLGMQIQVSLNNVQGKDYPYLYCVLVARHEFGLLERLKPEPPSGIVAEPKREQDVDIIVIRQRTTKTKGYHTKPATCTWIFMYALNEARTLFARRK